MKNMKSAVLFLAGVLLYASFFFLHERQWAGRVERLPVAQPVPYYRVLAGYVQELTAEMLFVRTNVFIGRATMQNKPLLPDGPAIAQNFEVVTTLYPRFLAPYYPAQAFLPDLSPDLAKRTNAILENGIVAYPEELSLRFSHAANYFLWMNDPARAGEAFAKAAAIAGAPPLYGRLAEMFVSPEGALKAGMLSLLVLRNAEKDPKVKEKYGRQLLMYERTIEVQSAVQAYIRDHGAAPATLEQLQPLYLPVVPVFDQGYTLIYDPPHVSLRRQEGSPHSGQLN
ncbi:MAG: hypothetical protein Q4G66_07345 [bacterium]|nr:hypothetical protein [bacterium]